jgi:hypothetical protein
MVNLSQLRGDSADLDFGNRNGASTITNLDDAD